MAEKGQMTGGAGNLLKGGIEMNVPKETNPQKNFEPIDNTKFSDEAWTKTRILIQDFEDFRPVAYRPTKNDVLTIGYGHTEGVKEGDTITKEEAQELFKKDFQKYSNLMKFVQIQLNNNEKAALTSFAYNVGPGAFRNSTLLRKLNNGDKEGAANEFDKWVYQKGVKLNGLVNRRLREKKLFLTPDKE